MCRLEKVGVEKEDDVKKSEHTLENATAIDECKSEVKSFYEKYGKNSAEKNNDNSDGKSIINHVKNNIKNCHEASMTSNYEKGILSQKECKLNSKNFDKLMSNRGLSEENIDDLKCSIDWKKDVTARHAKAGEKFLTTHGIDGCSGIFVSEKSLGDTPEKRINKGALPVTNTADFETIVELGKNQDVVYSTIAPQNKFKIIDPKHNPRDGGGEQVITNGGYKASAVVTRDPKYPIPVN